MASVEHLSAYSGLHEKLNIPHATEIEALIYDKTELIALHYFDMARLVTWTQTDEQVLELEPRGELTVIATFIKKEVVKDRIYRRGAVKKPKVRTSEKQGIF